MYNLEEVNVNVDTTLLHSPLRDVLFHQICLSWGFTEEQPAAAQGSAGPGTCEIYVLIQQKQHLPILLLEQPHFCLAKENLDSQNFKKTNKQTKTRERP